METRGWARRGSRSRRSASAAWGCPSSTAPRDEDESIATIHRALELGITFLDTADVYGPFTNERARRTGARGPARRGRARDEVRQRARPDGRAARHQRQARTTSAPRATRRSSGSASTRSTSTTSTASTSRRRSRRRSARWPSSSSAGKVRYLGLSEAAPATIRRAHAVHPISRAPDRVLAVDARSGGGDPADRARARDRLRRLQPARPRLPHRADPLARTISRRRTSAGAAPRFQAENFARNLELVGSGGGARRGQGRHARAARARLGAVARRRHRPDPGHEAAHVPGGERGGGGGRAHATRSSSASTRAFPPGRRPATAIRTCRPSTAERERLAGERGQHLSRHPDRRRHVARAVAVAAVGAAHALRGSGRRRAPGSRPAASNAWIAHAVDWVSEPRPVRELEAAVAVLVAAQEGDAAVDRRGRARRRRAAPGSPPRCRSSRAAPPASHDQPPEGRWAASSARTSAGGAGSPACRSARIVQIVALTSCPGRCARRRGSRSSGRSPAAARAIADERDVRRRPSALLRGEVVRRPAGVARRPRRARASPRRSAARRRSRRPRRCWACDVAGRRRRARSPRASSREQLHAHTTSVRERRS